MYNLVEHGLHFRVESPESIIGTLCLEVVRDRVIFKTSLPASWHNSGVI